MWWRRGRGRRGEGMTIGDGEGDVGLSGGMVAWGGGVGWVSHSIYIGLCNGRRFDVDSMWA